MLKRIALVVSIILSLNTYTQYDKNAKFLTKENNIVSEQNPWLLLDTTIAKLAEINYSNPIIAKELINNELLNLFDFNHISNHILHILDYDFTAEQNDYIADLVRSDVEHVLFTQLTSSDILDINIANVIPIRHNYLEISMHIKTNSYFPVMLKIIIHNNGFNWRIVDVNINNSSLVRYYQQVLLSKVNRYGISGIFK